MSGWCADRRAVVACPAALVSGLAWRWAGAGTMSLPAHACSSASAASHGAARQRRLRADATSSHGRTCTACACARPRLPESSLGRTSLRAESSAEEGRLDVFPFCSDGERAKNRSCGPFPPLRLRSPSPSGSSHARTDPHVEVSRPPHPPSTRTSILWMSGRERASGGDVGVKDFGPESASTARLLGPPLMRTTSAGRPLHKCVGKPVPLANICKIEEGGSPPPAEVQNKDSRVRSDRGTRALG